MGVHLHDNLLQAELGFTLAREHQKQGYATEAVHAVLDRLFRLQGLHKVTGECDARNTASAGLMERLGFTLEGRLRIDPEHRKRRRGPDRAKPPPTPRSATA